MFDDIKIEAKTCILENPKCKRTIARRSPNHADLRDLIYQSDCLRAHIVCTQKYLVLWLWKNLLSRGIFIDSLTLKKRVTVYFKIWK